MRRRWVLFDLRLVACMGLALFASECKCEPDPIRRVIETPERDADFAPNLAAALNVVRVLDVTLVGFTRDGKPVIEFDKARERNVRDLAGKNEFGLRAGAPDRELDPIDELIVRHPDPASLLAAAGPVPALTVRRVSESGSFAVVKFPRGITKRNLTAVLERGPSFVEPNFVIRADETRRRNATPQPIEMDARGLAYEKNWGLLAVHAPAAWNSGKNSTVVVAVLDSSVMTDHEDLQGNILLKDNGDVHGGEFLDHVSGGSSSSPVSSGGGQHGTHIAGVIGALANNGLGATGICWNVKIMPVRILDDELKGTVADAAAAIQWVVDQKTDEDVNVRVINASWVTAASDSVALAEALAAARDEDILVVAAAGNTSDMDVHTPLYPARWGMENLISVLSFNQKEKVTDSSRHGPEVDIGAPGSTIFNAVKDTTGVATYTWESGTSIATPFVSGGAALAWAKYPDLDAKQMRNLLMHYSREGPVEGERAVASLCSSGILDLSFLWYETGPLPASVLDLDMELLAVDGGSQPASIVQEVSHLPAPDVTVRGTLRDTPRGLRIEAAGFEWRVFSDDPRSLRSHLDKEIEVSGKLARPGKIIRVGDPRTVGGALGARVDLIGLYEEFGGNGPDRRKRIRAKRLVCELELAGLGRDLKEGDLIALSGVLTREQLGKRTRWLVRADKDPKKLRR